MHMSGVCDTMLTLWCVGRQAALEALEIALGAFKAEDHFQAVCQPLLATPLQHVQAAASTPAQVSALLVTSGQSIHVQADIPSQV